jgi:hypothetical protein
MTWYDFSSIDITVLGGDMDKKYTLTAAELPRKVRGTTGLYEDIVHDFIDSDLDTAIVGLPGRKPATVAIGLRSAIKSTKANVTVTQRGDKVFLLK